MEKGMRMGIIFGAIILTFSLIFFFFANQEVKPDNTDIISVGGDFGINEESGDVGMGEDLIIKESPVLHTIKITSSGFSPATLEVNSEDLVMFLNEGSASSWPASDVHPTHTVYPGSSRSKCGTSDEEKIFDACKGLGTGESYSFTFNEIGTWTYHDHLKPYVGGTIIVK